MVLEKHQEITGNRFFRYSPDLYYKRQLIKNILYGIQVPSIWSGQAKILEWVGVFNLQILVQMYFPLDV